MACFGSVLAVIKGFFRTGGMIKISIPLGSGFNTINLKHFTDQEVAGLMDPNPAMLDQARDILGQPIIITFTTGGQHCGHSTHYKGLAADLGLGHLAEGFDRDTYRWALIKAIYAAGYQRIEDCPLHVHVDTGQPPDYPSPVLILGQDA